MRHGILIGAAALLVFASIVGNGQATADESQKSTTKPVPTLAPSPAEAIKESADAKVVDDTPSDPDKATFKGRVLFKGDPPAPRRIQITKDPEICKAANTEIQEVVLGENGGLAGAVVEITGIKPADGESWTFKVPEKGYTLRQKNCGFLPSMLVVPNGSNIKVFNDDAVAHNVNTGAWNEMQPKDAPAIEKPIESRSPLRVSCNIHSWMEAWVYPVQSPFYAVTKKTGEFSIKNVPPGRYRIVVWHPNLGKKRERLEFAAGKTIEKAITYEAK